jgi:hypothetical protein
MRKTIPHAVIAIALSGIICATLATFPQTRNLPISAAGYLGANDADSGNAIDIGSGPSVLYAGSLVGQNFGVTPVNLLGGGAGVVVRLDASGRTILSITRLPSTVWDMEVSHETGAIAAVGAFGVVCLDTSAKSLLWRDSLAGNAGRKRVSIGADGAVGVLNTATGHVDVFSNLGASLSSFSAGGQYNNDIAVDGAGKHVIITGFTQKNVSGYCMGQLQVPWMRAFDYQGAAVWTDYDFTAQETEATNSSCADSRGLFVVIGRDGKLYLAGRSDGGNTIFRYDPLGPRTSAAAGVLTTTDWFANPYNMNGAASIGFYGRFNPATGAIEAGQQIVGRLSSGKANTVRLTGIDADESGNIYLCAAAACCMEFRDSLTINGNLHVGPYSGDSWVLVASADLTQRYVWMTFAGDTAGTGNKYDLMGIAAGHNIAAASGAASGNMITYQAIQPAHSDSIAATRPDGFFAVWKSGNPASVRSDARRTRRTEGSAIAGTALSTEIVDCQGRRIGGRNASAEMRNNRTPGSGAYLMIMRAPDGRTVQRRMVCW